MHPIVNYLALLLPYSYLLQLALLIWFGGEERAAASSLRRQPFAERSAFEKHEPTPPNTHAPQFHDLVPKLDNTESIDRFFLLPGPCLDHQTDVHITQLQHQPLLTSPIHSVPAPSTERYSSSPNAPHTSSYALKHPSAHLNTVKSREDLDRLANELGRTHPTCAGREQPPRSRSSIPSRPRTFACRTSGEQTLCASCLYLDHTDLTRARSSSTHILRDRAQLLCCTNDHSPRVRG